MKKNSGTKAKKITHQKTFNENVRLKRPPANKGKIKIDVLMRLSVIFNNSNLIIRK